MEYLNDKGKEVANNYYEGTLQMRNATKEMIKAVHDKIERNPKIFIAKEIKVKGGVDLLLSSQKIMQTIAKEIQKEFGGEYRITKRLFSRNHLTFKEVYRVTCLLRLPDFKVGDIVKAGARHIKITRLENKVFGIDVDSGKSISVDYSKVRK